MFFERQAYKQFLDGSFFTQASPRCFCLLDNGMRLFCNRAFSDLINCNLMSTSKRDSEVPEIRLQCKKTIFLRFCFNATQYSEN